MITLMTHNYSGNIIVHIIETTVFVKDQSIRLLNNVKLLIQVKVKSSMFYSRSFAM
jgi:hypothetical protein